MGVKASTSKLLIDTCDEFIFYDDLVRERGQRKSKGKGQLPKQVEEAFDLVIDAVEALLRENKEPHSSWTPRPRSSARTRSSTAPSSRTR